MPTQDFNIYTAKGYEGDLVDSGPRTVGTGVLTSATAGFGKAIQRDDLTVTRGAAIGSAEIDATSTTNVYAISQREYNREAQNRPSNGNDFGYIESDSMSIMREGFILVLLRDHAAVAGEALVVEEATGIFVGGTVAAGTVAGESVALNVYADEAGTVGEVIKARIDIVR